MGPPAAAQHLPCLDRGPKGHTCGPHAQRGSPPGSNQAEAGHSTGQQQQRRRQSEEAWLSRGHDALGRGAAVSGGVHAVGGNVESLVHELQRREGWARQRGCGKSCARVHRGPGKEARAGTWHRCSVFTYTSCFTQQGVPEQAGRSLASMRALLIATSAQASALLAPNRNAKPAGKPPPLPHLRCGEGLQAVHLRDVINIDLGHLRRCRGGRGGQAVRGREGPSACCTTCLAATGAGCSRRVQWCSACCMRQGQPYGSCPCRADSRGFRPPAAPSR